MNKSITQQNFEKSNMLISALVDSVSNKDNLQMYIVREFYKAYNNDNFDLAYQIVN